MKHNRLILNFIILSLFSINAHAELYKWVDGSGNVHYSDTAPPPSAKEQQAFTPQEPATSASKAPADKSVYQREADLQKLLKANQEADQKEAKKQQTAAIKQQNCNKSRVTLETLENVPRISTYDANGNRIILNDAQRQQQIDNARHNVSRFCN